MSSKAIEAMRAATLKGAEPAKIAAIWAAGNKADLKKALADMLKPPGVAATAAEIAAIDDTDADNLLAAKVNMTTGGVVPLY